MNRRKLNLHPFNPFYTGRQTLSYSKFEAGNLPLFFSQTEAEIPKFNTNFPMSDFMLHFGENFMKIAPKIIKLRLIAFRFVVDFDEYF